MSKHQWGAPDRNGIRACQRAGCLIRWWEDAWQERAGRRWHRVSAVAAPPCTDEPPSTRCTHIERVGIISNGQCSRHALPRLVVCEHHAAPDAVRMVILAMHAEIERLGHEVSNG